MLQVASAEPRSMEILDRVKQAFAGKGFDGASMQDLARAAGMSAGNFYRYFPSKNAIIAAMVERELAELGGEFAEIMQSPDPHDSFMRVIRRRIERPKEDDGPLWAEIEAAASRRPEIEAIRRRMENDIGTYMLRVFARISGLTEETATARFAPQASFVMLLVKGVCTRNFRVAGFLPSPNTARLNALVLDAVETVLTEIAGARCAPSVT